MISAGPPGSRRATRKRLGDLRRAAGDRAARGGSGPVTAARRLRALAIAALMVCAGCGATAASARTEGWKALAPSTVPRTEVAAARIGDAVYVVGGFVSPGATTALVERDAAGGARAAKPLATLEVYDLRRDRWSRGVDALPPRAPRRHRP